MSAHSTAGPHEFRRLSSVLVESIWWDDDRERVVWCDISAGLLHLGPWDGAIDGSDDVVVELPPPLSAVQPAADGGFVAALGDRVVRLDAGGAITGTLAEIAHRHPLLRLNEGKCDPFGAFVVGSMELGEVEPEAAAGAVYRVAPDGSLTTMLGGLGVANGFEWSDDGREFYFTDTAASTVYRVAYGPAGIAGEPEPLLVGRPSDGLARDVDGCFWNGLYGEGRLVRWSPSGEVLDEVELPAPNVTSVAFAGPGLRTLLVGTARENLDEGDLVRHPLSGSILALPTTTAGRPVGVFG